MTKSKKLLGLSFGIALLSPVAQTATYNFYFNNAEQGDNSTANPTVTVDSPENEKKEDETSSEKTPTPPPPVVSPNPPINTQAKWDDEDERKRFRAWGSLMRTSSKYPKQDFTGRASDGDDMDLFFGIDALAGFGFYPFKHLGMNVLAGTHSDPKDTAFVGVELDFVPLNTELFEIGLIAGLWTLTGYKEVDDGFDKSFFGQKYARDGMGSAYGGVRLGFKVNDNADHRVGWIANVTGRGNTKYFNVDAGVGLMF